jgi:hypothetical protein
MQCPECQSTHIRKNGNKKGKQNHICVIKQILKDVAVQLPLNKISLDLNTRDMERIYVNYPALT